MGDILGDFAEGIFVARARSRSLEKNGASEFSYGNGLNPPGLENADPAEGGRYHGKSPRQDRDIRMGKNHQHKRHTNRRGGCGARVR